MFALGHHTRGVLWSTLLGLLAGVPPTYPSSAPSGPAPAEPARLGTKDKKRRAGGEGATPASPAPPRAGRRATATCGAASCSRPRTATGWAAEGANGGRAVRRQQERAAGMGTLPWDPSPALSPHPPSRPRGGGLGQTRPPARAASADGASAASACTLCRLVHSAEACRGGGARARNSGQPAGQGTPRRCAYRIRASCGHACGRRRPLPLASAAPHLLPRPTRRRHHRSTRNVRPGRAGRRPPRRRQPPYRLAWRADTGAHARHAGRGGWRRPAAGVASHTDGPSDGAHAGSLGLAVEGCLRGCSPSPRRSQPAEGGGRSPLRGRRRRQPWPRWRGQVRHPVSPPRATGRCRRRSMRKVRPAAPRPPPSSPATISAGLAPQHAQAPTRPRAAAARTSPAGGPLLSSAKERGLVMARREADATQAQSCTPTLLMENLLKFPDRSLGDALPFPSRRGEG